MKCPVCEQEVELSMKGLDLPVLHNVIGGGRRKSRCPSCGSSDRERLIYVYLRGKNLSGSVLHVAPEKNLRRLLEKEATEYVAADMDAPNCVPMDIRSIPYPDDHFYLIVCSHVLEHIEDDLKAMSELRRVLLPRGTAILQVPIIKGDHVEDPGVRRPEDRERLFGQNDHVRIYSIHTYVSRLMQAGFKVTASWSNAPGMNSEEPLFICTK